MTNLINQEIPRLIEWLRANRLSLNIAKTNVMIFGPNRTTQKDNINIIIEGITLNITKSTKFLGIVLDSNLTWKDHILYLSKKVARSIGILSIARKVLNQKSLITLYYSFMYPYLTYCLLIWGNSPLTTLWPVYKLQKIAIRILANLKKRESSLSFCKKQKILRLPEIYTLYTGIFMFKFNNSLLPDIYHNLFTRNHAFHNYPTRISDKLRIPLAKTKIGGTFITKTGVQIWNGLPIVIQEKTRIGGFKHSLISHLLDSY